MDPLALAFFAPLTGSTLTTSPATPLTPPYHLFKHSLAPFLLSILSPISLHERGGFFMRTRAMSWLSSWGVQVVEKDAGAGRGGGAKERMRERDEEGTAPSGLETVTHHRQCESQIDDREK